jgi:hypothetical protein
MTPQERELIEAVAQRLRGARLTEKDAEAERFIQAQIGSQPDALYLLTQAVIVQEQGLKHAQERIQQLEAAVQQAGGQQKHGGFLSSLFGGGQAAAPQPPAVPQQPAYGPAPAGPSAAGSFLRTAAAAAAGVVGGQLIFDGLRNMFGGGFGGSPFGGGGFLGGPTIVNEYVTNVDDGPGPGADSGYDSGTDDSGGGDFQDSGDDSSGSYDDSYDGSGGDFDDSGDSGDSGGDF